MKKTLLFIVAVIALSVTTVASAQNAYTETRNVKDFDEVSFSLAGEVYITFGSDYKVVLEGDKDYLEKIETKVIGSNLEIKTDKWYQSANEKLIAHITMPSIKGLSIAGSAKAVVSDPLKASSFDLSIAGSGKVYVRDVNIDDFEVSIAGSGRIEIAGSGSIKDAELSISGSGVYVGTETKIATMEISIAGSGRCECYVTESIEGSIAGSGNITYSGNPKIDASVFGSGHIRKK